jgi:RNA polymerase sigma-70 factor (ECF subfamily)
MGGPDAAFHTTQWTEILSVGTADVERRNRAEGAILAQYWKPVYSYLRCKGFSNEQGKDLTQGFFCDVVLGKELIPQADRKKGRFRSFLLTALDHYVSDVLRKDRAQKRRPAGKLVSLDGAADLHLLEPVHQATPEQAFHRAWARQLLGEILDELEQSCRWKGQQSHWKVFQARCLRPTLEGAEPVPLGDLCAQLGIPDEKTAANMAVTLKRRFAALMRNKVSAWVHGAEEVDGEIKEIIALLCGAGASRPTR